MSMSCSIEMLRYLYSLLSIVCLTACNHQGRIIPGAYKFNALVTTYEVILGECISSYVFLLYAVHIYDY